MATVPIHEQALVQGGNSVFEDVWITDTLHYDFKRSGDVGFSTITVDGTATFASDVSFAGDITLDEITCRNADVTGIATVKDLVVKEKLRDGDGNFGSSGQLLSSDGTDLVWINANTTSVANATNVGVNVNGDNSDQFISFFGSSSGNQPNRVDADFTYNPSTNTMSGINYSDTSTFNNTRVTGITTTGILEVEGELRDGDGNFGTSGQILSSDGTDTKWINTSNTTYTYDSVASGSDVNLRLIGSDGTNDDVLITAGSNITVSSVSTSGFTLSATDTNTTYTYDAVASGSNVNLRLIGSDGTNDDVLLTAGTGINFSSVSSAGLTINSEGLKDRTTASVTTSSIANDAIANVSLSIPSVSTLLKLQTSAAAWVTLYYNTASRTADANRSIYADPVAGLGVLAEVVTTGAETIGMSPAPILWNNDSTPADTIYAKVVNRSGSTQAITVTATYLQNEK